MILWSNLNMFHDGFNFFDKSERIQKVNDINSRVTRRTVAPRWNICHWLVRKTKVGRWGSFGAESLQVAVFREKHGRVERRERSGGKGARSIL